MTVLRWLLLAIGLHAAACVPFLLLVDADHLTPAWLRTWAARLPLTLAALLLLLGGTS